MPAGQDDFDGDPEIATDKPGRWMIVWSSFNPLAGTGADSDILFVHSSDNGMTWSAPAPLDPGAAADAVSDDIPQIETSGAGGADQDIYTARSGDGGVSWPAAKCMNSPRVARRARADFVPVPGGAADPGDRGQSLRRGALEP